MNSTAATSTFSNFGDAYEAMIDSLVELGFQPINGDNSALADQGLDGKAIKTIEYYGARRGFAAVRVTEAFGSVVLTFADYGDEGCRVCVTNGNGIIDAEGRFDWSPLGRRMFVRSLEA